MYNSENIIWVKNVKPSNQNGWAYDNINCGETFLLHWSTKKKGSASTPKTGDIIVLFQRPNQINGRNNAITHFTHLVSPISNTVFEDSNSPSHKWCREVKLIAIANPITSIPNPSYYNFFLANRGLTNPIINLTTRIPFTEREKQEDIWRLFKGYLCPDVIDSLSEIIEPIGIYGELEGDKVIKMHIQQEITNRNSKVVKDAKTLGLLSNNGRLKCECCNFDFVESYGELGSEFIECHHKIPLSKGERLTSPEDLALVCPNCHRMLHRKLENGEYHSVESLKELIFKHQSLSIS